MKRKIGTKEWSDHSANWQIGCEHGCLYCVSPDTLILMADGTQRPIAQVNVGDHVVGVYNYTVSGRWQIVPSVVEAKWATRKRAFEVALEGGTKLRCSADHRWLTNRGWRRTARKGCRSYIPQLTKANTIYRVGVPQLTQEDSRVYQQGYLWGSIMGDGTHGRYVYGTKRHHAIVTSFRLACVDREIVETTEKFLMNVLGVEVRNFNMRNPTHRSLYGIRTNKKADHRRISFFLTRFNPCALQSGHPGRCLERARGFLAGIFDAEGSCSNGCLRIVNKDEQILGNIETAFDMHGFRHVRDKTNVIGCAVVRMVGGMSEVVRFFSLVHPRISRKFALTGMSVKGGSARVVKVSRVGRVDEDLVDIQTSTGNFIANGCIAHNCYAREQALRFKRIARPEDWTTEVSNPKGVTKLVTTRRNGIWMAPTTHDITVDNLEESRRLLFRAAAIGNRLLIVSKPRRECIEALIADLKPYKDRVEFRFSIGCLDDEIRKFWEPGAPRIIEREKCIVLAVARGFRVSVSCEPLLEPWNVLDLVEVVGSMTDGEIWIGCLNKLRQRTAWAFGSRELSTNERELLAQLELWQQPGQVQQVYESVKGIPGIRFKDSYQRVLGLKSCRG